MDSFPIDVVITWVDGSDPRNMARRQAYMAGEKYVESDDIGGPTRYISTGEILVCVGSVLAFAPFVRKIFIVTDGQDPHLESFIAGNFPDSRIPVEIVDHKAIFEGFEQYLPTFNSLSIESMLYRIPGLSEHFVYMNDDYFLIRKITPEDWFDNGRAVCFGKKSSTAVARLLRALKPCKSGHKPFGYADSLLNAADMAGSSYFWYMPYAPLVLRKSWFEKYYSVFPEVVEHNIQFKFRNPSQFNPQALFFIRGEKEGLCTVHPEKGRTLFIKSRFGRSGYMKKMLEQAEKSGNYTYGCIDSIDQASEEDRRMFGEWISARMGLKENVWANHVAANGR